MEFVALWQSVILGLVEGLTEFLPISSTGHLIIASDFMSVAHNALNETYLVVIQAGAILAVCWYYRERIFNVVRGLFKKGPNQQLAINTVVAFLPAAVFGVLLESFLKHYLFNAITVSVALIVGGLIILWTENRIAERPNLVRVQTMNDMTAWDALGVGFSQCLAMIPGTSRSGATIIGGMLLGLSRKSATEFSFFLAIPTILGATAYDMLSHYKLLADVNLTVLAVGLVVSFISALVTVHWLISFVSQHSFKAFGWYRIVFGAVILFVWYMGWVQF